MAKSRNYDYSPPAYQDTVDRAERKGSMFDNLLKEAKVYKSKQGANLVRILPPGWPKAAHYGLTIFVHGSVGPNDRRYLCLRENPTSPHKRCPVCEALYDLGAKATQEDRQLLRAKPNVIYYIVDRDAEKDGVQVWMASPTTDSEIAAQSINRRSKSVIDIVDPDEGYDLEFTRTGTTRNNTRYRGFQIMREPSPLAESSRTMDEWLDVAFDKPLPSLLNYFSPEHIEEVFYGRAKEEGEVGPPRSRARDQEDEAEERPLRRTRRVSDDDEEEEPPARERPRRSDGDGEEERRPARAARRERAEPADDDDGAAETSRPSASRRRATATDDEEEPTNRPRPRSRLSRELDDEVPFDGAGRRGRPNGRAAEEEEKEPTPRARPRRPTLDDDEEEEERPRSTRAPRGSRAPDDEETDDDAAARERRRERVRERVNRG
jgi:hypothetical protein